MFGASLRRASIMVASRGFFPQSIKGHQKISLGHDHTNGDGIDIEVVIDEDARRVKGKTRSADDGRSRRLCDKIRWAA
jgi:hypothetical protein